MLNVGDACVIFRLFPEPVSNFKSHAQENECRPIRLVNVLRNTIHKIKSQGLVKPV